MTDHPRRRHGAEDIEAPSHGPEREPGPPDEIGPGEAYPEQPTSPATEAELMKGESEGIAATPGPPPSDLAAGNRPDRSGT